MALPVDRNLGNIIKPNFSTSLEAARVLSKGACLLMQLEVKIDKTAPAGTYFVLIVEPNAGGIPADGSVTLLDLPRERTTTGAVDTVTIKYRDGLPCPKGCVAVLSTTETTKTTTLSIYAKFSPELRA